MNEPLQTQSVLAVSNFVAYLRTQGFVVDAAHYLRLQAVLDQSRIGKASPDDMELLDWAREERTPLDWEKLDLKTLLCPIFATTRDEQRRFYKLFDEYPDLLPSLVGGSGPVTPPESPDKLEPFAARLLRLLKTYWQKWRWRFLIILALALCLAAILYFLITGPKPPGAINANLDTNVNANVNSNTDANTGGNDSTKQDNGPQKENNFDPNAPPPNNQTNRNANSNSGNGSVTPPGGQPTWGFKSSLLTLALLLAVWGGYELWRLVRRRRILASQHTRTPPYSWPLRIEKLPEIYITEEFYAAARRLRRRQVDEFHRLDVNATVAATIKANGYLTLRERPDSKPPEYLVLINRCGPRDHQARLFGELANMLKRHNIFLKHFFYDGDPRTCYEADGETPIHLAELRTRYSGHRLLVFGEGDALIDPLDNGLEAWTSLFEVWRERAFLTNTATWGAREMALATSFIVLPADTRSLLRLPNLFVAATRFSDHREQVSMPVPSLEGDARLTVRALRQHLGADLFLWLCACAVAPKLQWELTLNLGVLPFMPTGLVTDKSLLRLTQLSWFRTGEIPGEIRWLLTRQLRPEHERVVRSVLINFLEHPESHPPVTTYAAAAHKLELLAQYWLTRPDRLSYRRLLKFLRTLPPSQVNRDRTLLRLLKRFPSSRFARLLAPRVREVVYRRGIPGFGPSAALLSALVLLLNLLLFTALYSAGVSDPIARMFPPTIAATPTPAASPSFTPNTYNTTSVNNNTGANSNSNTTQTSGANMNNQNSQPSGQPAKSGGGTNINRPVRNRNGSRSTNPAPPADSTSGNTDSSTTTGTGTSSQPSSSSSSSSSEQNVVNLVAGDRRGVPDELKQRAAEISKLDPSLRLRIGLPSSVSQDSAEQIRQKLVDTYGADPQRIDVVPTESGSGPSLSLMLPPGAQFIGGIPLVAGSGRVDTMVEVPDNQTYSKLEGTMKASVNSKVFLVYGYSETWKNEDSFTYSMSMDDVRNKLLKAGIDASRIVTIDLGQTRARGNDGINFYVQPGNTQPGAPLTRKFDEFGFITEEEANSRLDNLASSISNEPGSVAYIISYGMIQGRGRTSFQIRNTDQNAGRNRANRYKNYLVKIRGFNDSQVIIVDGGLRNEPGIELFVVPPGATPPSPTPATLPPPGNSNR